MEYPCLCLSVCVLSHCWSSCYRSRYAAASLAMGCGASRHAAAGPKSCDAPLNEKVGSATDGAPAEAINAEAAAEREGSKAAASEGRMTSEPSKFRYLLRVQRIIVAARLRFGIDGNPDQFKATTVYMSPSRLRHVQRRIIHWLQHIEYPCAASQSACVKRDGEHSATSGLSSVYVPPSEVPSVSHLEQSSIESSDKHRYSFSGTSPVHPFACTEHVSDGQQLVLSVEALAQHDRLTASPAPPR